MLAEEVLDQRAHVLLAIAKRRDVERDDGEPVVEVLAELALAHQPAQIAVGGGHDADIDRDRRRAADALDLLLLEHAQERRLHLGRHLADLVEEDRAGVRELEAPAAQTVRAGERALLVPEQLALDHALGERRAVDAHERPRGARARVVDQPRDQLLAGAGLAGDEQRRVGLRSAPRERRRRPGDRRVRRPRGAVSYCSPVSRS